MTASPASPALDDFVHPCWRRPFSLTAPLPTLPSTFPTTGERCSGHGPVSRSPLLEAQVPSPEVHSCPSHCFCHFLTYNNPSSLPYLNFFLSFQPETYLHVANTYLAPVMRHPFSSVLKTPGRMRYSPDFCYSSTYQPLCRQTWDYRHPASLELNYPQFL